MSAQPQWDDTAPALRPVEVPQTGASAEPDRNAARIASVVALASIGAGAIHIAAAATIARGNAQMEAFFGVVATAQIVWGLLTLVWAPRWWLVLGALGNAVVVVTWIVSRTVALPFGPYAHVVLPVGFADTVATILGAVTIMGAAALAVRGSGAGRAAARARGFTLAAAVLIGALALAGVVSQAHASSGGGGGGGQSGPTAPYGGNGGTVEAELRPAVGTVGAGSGRRLRLLTGIASTGNNRGRARPSAEPSRSPSLPTGSDTRELKPIRRTKDLVVLEGLIVSSLGERFP